MRTFPRELAEFRNIVNSRGQGLRELSIFGLLQADKGPTEHISVGAKNATISIIVQLRSDGRYRVVIQGFMDAWIGRSVALDGFYKNADGTVEPMPDEEFYEFD